MRRLLLVPIVAAAAASTSVQAQTDAAAFAAMDAVYERFTRAYAMTSVDSVLALYTDSSLYLPGQGPVHQGREALRAQFDFLNGVRQRSSSARISFESVARGASGDLAWDVGYYTLVVEDAEGNRSPPSRGKFTTVWRRGTDGVWRIHVDSFSPAPPA